MNTNVLGLFAPSTVKKYDYWFIFLLSYCYIRWDLLWNGTGISVLVFTILFCGFFSLRLDLDHRITAKQKQAARPWLLTVILSAVAAAWFDYTPLGWINFLFLTCAVLCWLSVLTGTRFLPQISNYLPLELLSSLFGIPFSNFGRFFSAVFQRNKTESIDDSISDSTAVTKRHTVIRSGLLILFTLFMIAPLLLIVLNLLAYADESFMRLVAHLIDEFFALFRNLLTLNVLEILRALLLGIPVAAYLFGLLWAYTHPDQAKGLPQKALADQKLHACRFLPRIMIFTALLTFTIVYLLFLGLQAFHLAEALQNGLPDTTTYSRFAREGFFELCAVAFINLMLLAGVWLLAKRTSDGDVPSLLRWMLSLLSVQTILLVITAMTKMALYIQVYGLTRLRVYTSWFMLWLLLVFVVLTLATARKRGVAAEGRLTPAKALTVLTIVMFLMLNYLNVDALIVRDHIDRAQRDPLVRESFDAGYLWSLSGNARLALLDYYDGEIPKELIPHGYWDGHGWERASITSIRLNSQLKTP